MLEMHRCSKIITRLRISRHNSVPRNQVLNPTTAHIVEHVTCMTERATLTIHGNHRVANEDIRGKAGPSNGSVKGRAEGERREVAAGFENEREGVVVGGPIKCLHANVKAQNFVRVVSEAKRVPY